MRCSFLILECLALGATAFPWAVERANAEASTLETRSNICPVHASRQGAAPYSGSYPSAYTGAKNGLPGTGKGGSYHSTEVVD